MAVVRLNLNRSAVRELLQGPSGPVVRHVKTLTRRVTNQAKRNCPVDEGTLRASIQGFVFITPGAVIGRIGTGLEYGLYQEQGTGIYGPRHSRVVPVSRQFLRFEVKNGTAARGRRPLVFARSVAGTPPTRFLTRALRTVVPYPVTEHPR